VSAVLVLTLFTATPTVAQDARIAQLDAEVIGTVLRFIDALEAGDAKALEQLIVAETYAQDRARAAFAQLAAAEKALERVATTRFGDQAKRLRSGFDIIFSAADRKAIQSAKIYYDEFGRGAHLEKSGELSPMILRLSDQRQWQVQLYPIDEIIEQGDFGGDGSFDFPRPPTTQPRLGPRTTLRINRFNGMADAFNQTRAGIESGQLANATAAETDLRRRLDAVAAEAARARAALPSRR
jgi:hypothetical protein